MNITEKIEKKNVMKRIYIYIYIYIYIWALFTPVSNSIIF